MRGLRFPAVVAAGALLLNGVVRAVPQGGTPELAKAGAYRAADADTQRGATLAGTRCAACHGADGNSSKPQYPKLAGLNPAYLYSQLQAFATGQRPSNYMPGIAAALSAQDATDLAAFYALQTRHADPVQDSALAAAGRALFYARTGRGMMSSCAACHEAGKRQRMVMMGMMGGRGMMGMASSNTATVIPLLNGQHAAYLLDQLNRFASGERPGVMDQIAAGLDTEDRKALAEYLSGLR